MTRWQRPTSWRSETDGMGEEANVDKRALSDLQPWNLSTHSGCWTVRLTLWRGRAAPFRLVAVAGWDAAWQGCTLLNQLTSAASRTRLLRTRLLRSRRSSLLPRRLLPPCVPLALPAPSTSPVTVVFPPHHHSLRLDHRKSRPSRTAIPPCRDPPRLHRPPPSLEHLFSVASVATIPTGKSPRLYRLLLLACCISLGSSGVILVGCGGRITRGWFSGGRGRETLSCALCRGPP